MILTLNLPPQHMLKLERLGMSSYSGNHFGGSARHTMPGRLSRFFALHGAALFLLWAIIRQGVHGITPKRPLSVADGQMGDGALWLVLAGLARIYPFRRVNRAINR